jgi:hypothetical protein
MDLALKAVPFLVETVRFMAQRLRVAFKTVLTKRVRAPFIRRDPDRVHWTLLENGLENVMVGLPCSLRVAVVFVVIIVIV